MTRPLSVSVPLPSAWRASVQRAVLCAISLAHLSLVQTRAWCADSRLARVRLKAENARLRTEVAQLRQIQRIKDARMARIPAANRPHYAPEERFEILSLRAAASWSVATTARVFQIAAGTIAIWARRLDEGGSAALLALPVPVNKLPECHSLVVEQLRTLLPTMGKRRIAQLLTRAGVSLAASTVKRIRDRKRRPKPPSPPAPAPPPVLPERPRYPGIRAKRAHHVWHVDLTLVPLVGRFFCVWFPFSVPQCWPFYWWVAAVLDQHSRAVMAKGVFKTQPSAEQLCRMLDRAKRRAGCGPTHIISDQGAQFRGEYRAWCRRAGAKPRFGAVGSSASIALLERFWRSMKDEACRVIHVPHGIHAMRAELDAYVTWYNEYRPHQALRGLTPKQRLEGSELPAHNRSGGRPRSEPRAPPVLVVTRFRGREHLPIVELREAA